MKIYISIPCADQKIFFKCSESLFKLIKEFDKNYIQYSINYSYGSLISRIRNNETHKFLKSDCDYLLFIDSDVYNFEYYIVKVLMDMIKYKYQVVGLSYPLKQFNDDLLLHNINNKKPLFDTCTSFNINLLSSDLGKNLESIDKNGYLEVKHLPTGCLLVNRFVFYELAVAKVVKSYVENNETIFNYFDCRIYKDHYLSEDYSFCQYCHEMNIKNYCLVSANLSHIGYFNYKGNLKDCMKKFHLIF